MTCISNISVSLLLWQINNICFYANFVDCFGVFSSSIFVCSFLLMCNVWYAHGFVDAYLFYHIFFDRQKILRNSRKFSWRVETAGINDCSDFFLCGYISRRRISQWNMEKFIAQIWNESSAEDRELEIDATWHFLYSTDPMLSFPLKASNCTSELEPRMRSPVVHLLYIFDCFSWTIFTKMN